MGYQNWSCSHRPYGSCLGFINIYLIMKIFVLVKTGARESKVEKIDDTTYKVSVKSPPVEGAANKEVEEVLAEYLDCPKSQVYIVSGFKNKSKVVEIPDLK